MNKKTREWIQKIVYGINKGNKRVKIKTETTEGKRMLTVEIKFPIDGLKDGSNMCAWVLPEGFKPPKLPKRIKGKTRKILEKLMEVFEDCGHTEIEMWFTENNNICIKKGFLTECKAMPKALLKEILAIIKKIARVVH